MYTYFPFSPTLSLCQTGPLVLNIHASALETTLECGADSEDPYSKYIDRCIRKSLSSSHRSPFHFSFQASQHLPSLQAVRLVDIWNRQSLREGLS